MGSVDRPVLVSVREAASLLGISPRMVHELVRRGDLPSVKIGARRLFRPESLAAWAMQQERREGKNEAGCSRLASGSF